MNPIDFERPMGVRELDSDEEGPSVERDKAQADGNLKSTTKPDRRRWELFPFTACEEVVRVLEYGAEKYAPNNWQFNIRSTDADNKYFAAMMRHLVSWRQGERQDPDSGLHPLAHLVASALFILWRDCGRRLLPSQPRPGDLTYYSVPNPRQWAPTWPPDPDVEP